MTAKKTTAPVPAPVSTPKSTTVDSGAKAVLVHVCISAWSARRYDRKASSEVLNQNNAEDREGAKLYKILVNDPNLDAYKTRTNALRGFVYRNTLPWLDGGTRILPTAKYFDFMAKYSEIMMALDEDLDKFIASYTESRHKARKRLGNLFDDSDYPEPASVRKTFDVNLTTFPVPSAGDWRVEGAERPSYLEGMTKAAETENWRRIVTLMHRMRKVLGNEDSPMRDSMFEAVGELCEELPKLNITDNTEINDMLDKIKKELGGLDGKALKKDPRARKKVAEKAESFHKKASGFFKALNPNGDTNDEGEKG